MDDRLSKLIRRWAKAGLLTGFLGLTLGFMIFYGTFSNVSVPPVIELSPLVAVGPLFASALLVGIMSDDLLVGIAQAFLAIPTGAMVASALALSPALTGLVIVGPDEVVLFVIRSGLIWLVSMIPINVLGIFFGAVVREKLRLDRA